MDADSSPCDVLVVGAGPVGLTAALALLRHGLSCRIIDCAPRATDKSKALVLWGRTLELLDQAGVADEFVAAGMFANGASFYSGGKRVLQIKIDRDDTAYPRPLMLPQSETERLLSACLERAGARVERSVELTELYDDGQHVSAMLRHSDGRQENIVAAWLVGCDGAHSTVRKQLGIEFQGEAEPNDWILADVHLDGEVASDELSIFWHRHGILAFFPITPMRFRVIADLGKALGTEKPADPTLDEVQAVVEERGPAGVRVRDPIWLSGFRIHERKVKEYGKGRVFLAGDAAHIHSPAGGQGMNTGMQDAFNLAWKLALVAQNYGSADPLLESYRQERSAVGEMVLRNATFMTRMATIRNPALQLVRNHLAPLIGSLRAVQERAIASLTEMDIHYPDSLLNGDDPGDAWGTEVRAGDRLPDAVVHVAGVGGAGSGKVQRLHNVLRVKRHVLLLLPDDGDTRFLETWTGAENPCRGFSYLVQPVLLLPQGAKLPGTVGKHILPEHILVDEKGEVRSRLGVKRSAIALVRPDGYLNFRGHGESRPQLMRHLGTYLFPAG